MTCLVNSVAAPASASSKVPIDWAVWTSSGSGSGCCGSIDGSGSDSGVVVFWVSAGNIDSAVVVGVDLAKRALLLADPSFGLDEASVLKLRPVLEIGAASSWPDTYSLTFDQRKRLRQKESDSGSRRPFMRTREPNFKNRL
jgi:hypothetical protein